MPDSFTPDTVVNWGDTVWYSDQNDHRLFAVDLLAGSINTAADAGTHGYVSSPATNGISIAWAESQPHGATFAWSIKVMPADGSTPPRSIDTGVVSRRGPGLVDIAPSVAVDDQYVAYSVDAPTPNNPLASAVVVRRLSEGGFVRRIDAEFVPFDVAIGNGAVLFSQGHVNTAGVGEFYDTRLMLSRSGESTATQIATDAYEVSMDGDRLIWNEYPNNPGSGPVGAENVVTATLADLTPQRINRAGASSSTLAVAGAGFAAWDETSNDTHHLILWDSTTRKSVPVADADVSRFIASIGGGTLAWAVYTQVDGNYVYGLFGTELPQTT